MSENIIDDALNLPSDLRLKLVEKLIESLNLPTAKEINDEWVQESERRVKEIEEGKVQPLSGEDVLKELRRRYEK